MESFSILPVSQNFDIEAGGAYEGTIKVVNPADAAKDFNFVASVVPYSVLGNEYETDFATRSNYNFIVDWITIENSKGSVAPNGVAEIHFKIDVPLNAPAGGQYAAIAVHSADAESDPLVQSYFEIASIIYAKVAGETKHEGAVLTNSLPGFVTSLPAKSTVTVKNDGNVHEQMITKISIKNAFTGEVLFPKDDDEKFFQDTIMPQTERYVTRNLSRMSSIGVFEVTQDVTYLGEIYPLTRVVIACPIWFLFLLIFTIGVVIGMVTAMIRRNIKRKRAMKI